MKIQVLALDDVFDMGLSALLDTLDTANELARLTGMPVARPTVTTVGVRRRVRTSRGLSVPVKPVGQAGRPDVILLPALGAKMPDTLRAALTRRDVADACGYLREWSSKGVLIGAACTGTFVLAESALLDGRRATTTWWLSPLFRERYPKVTLDDSRMLVESPPCITAGAALSHVDLALWLVRRSSPTLAGVTARYLLVEPRPSQAPFVIPDHLAHADPLVERFEQWARRTLGEPFSMDAAARAVGASARTLSRRMQAVLGKSPLSYVQSLRVERAAHLLQTTTDSVDDIAAQVGYADGLTLRTLIRRTLGCTIRELRAR